MLKSIRLKNFKNFADETLHLGPFSVITGANASGKSNVRDALRFLHGIGRRYTLAEIIGGKQGVASTAEWLPIRGGINEIGLMGMNEISIEVSSILNRTPVDYLVHIGRKNTEPYSLKKEGFTRIYPKDQFPHIG